MKMWDWESGLTFSRGIEIRVCRGGDPQDQVASVPSRYDTRQLLSPVTRLTAKRGARTNWVWWTRV
jgi:hypothetical protein